MLFPIFDTDQHITEPPDLWTSRLPKKYQGVAPHLVDDPEVGQAWAFGDDGLLVTMGLQSTGSQDPRRHDTARRYDEIDPACFDAKKRIEVMDIDGVGVTLLFPSVLRNVSAIRDDGAYLACIQAYNDAVHEWAQEGDPKRIFPGAMLPFISIEHSMAELERVAKLGFKHYMFNQWPSTQPYPSKEDDRFWALLQETGLTISFHGFGSGRTKFQPVTQTTTAKRKYISRGRSQEMVAADRAAGLASATPLATLILTGILERFPNLKIALIETSVGWMPSFVERLDAHYQQHRWLSDHNLSRLPSAYAKEFFVSWDREWFGVKHRAFVGSDKLMFGTDFPHIGSFYPHSRFYLDLVLQGVSQTEQKQMLWDNPASLYGIEYPKSHVN